MNNFVPPELSFVIPVYNEDVGLTTFHADLINAVRALKLSGYEVIYVNDGSTDKTLEIAAVLAKKDSHVKILSLSRNFGKEIATTAGIHIATGQAIIMLDADGQHPVTLIKKFISKWQAGNKVVVGIRTDNQKEGFVKRYGSKLFYSLFNQWMGMKLLPGSSDFRLIDRTVQQEFVRMTERNRVTRNLIDWLGYDRDYIYFKANARTHGEASYSFKKLFKLAVDSVISQSTSPLYVATYIGVIIMPLSLLLGVFMVVEMLIGDPLSLRVTGGAYVLVLVLFLIGILLLSQGIIGLYLSSIHNETQGRPLYIVDRAKSIGVHE
jgi:glycosyltransferase involved in cell wall biosynthesis